MKGLVRAPLLLLLTSLCLSCSKMSALNDGDSIGRDVRMKSLNGTVDIGFGESWQLKWGEWNPPGLARLFITDASLHIPAGNFDAFGYEVGEPPEDPLPCSLVDPGNYRIIAVTNVVDGVPQPIIDNIYRMHFVFPSGAHNTYISVDICLARNNIDGDPHELLSTTAHLRFH